MNRVLPSRKKALNASLNNKEFWQGKTDLYSRPLHIQVCTNLTCNLKCVFCRRQIPEEKVRLKNTPRDKLHMSDEVLDRVLELMPYANIVNLAPYGEPLLFKKLNKILERHSETGSKNLALTTNGMLLTEELARKLVEASAQILFLSVDTCDPDVYASMRIEGRLEQVENGLRALNSEKRRLGSKTPKIVFTSTFMQRNIPQLPDMIDFAKKHSVDEISVQLMQMENKDLERESLKYHIELTRKKIDEAKKRAAEAGVTFRIHLALESLLEAEKLSREKKEKISKTAKKTLVEKCNYPWNFLLIDIDGDVRPCCYASISLGNIVEKPFEEIWNGACMQKTRRDFLNSSIPSFCRDKHCRVDL